MRTRGLQRHFLERVVFDIASVLPSGTKDHWRILRQLPAGGPAPSSPSRLTTWQRQVLQDHGAALMRVAMPAKLVAVQEPIDIHLRHHRIHERLVSRVVDQFRAIVSDRFVGLVQDSAAGGVANETKPPCEAHPRKTHTLVFFRIRS